ncbi:hypothetical protein B0I27_11272 [Arcticibacter pallidicorallinus]|uniref:Uncharacterized protein n=1 Tax=Arcticibacter pallidicorallinus TaxID=1259464 RepID=A0A2T0TU50_9SPHI|nr:hypothetical protein [Arcticibacter pallidicorallinus]PRY49187.1 hypothetical protein B0I27_11272 [Arcticibacter pallidicorallinus]
MKAETTSLAGTGSNIQGLYLSSRNWLSYIDFFEDEIKFLNKLMLKFFMVELNDDRINKIQLINCSINSLDRKKNTVLSKIFCHQANLKATIEELMDLSENYLTVQHESIQQDVMALQTTLDEIKADLYLITEAQIKQSRWESSMTG